MFQRLFFFIAVRSRRPRISVGLTIFVENLRSNNWWFKQHLRSSRASVTGSPTVL
jgi:hypothetical protein